MESDIETKTGELKLLGVKLKVVSEDLATESDSPENLDLTATCGKNECRVSLVRSELSVSSCNAV